MILNTSAYAVPLVQAGITYNAATGFWESSSSFSSIGNSTVIHDYAVLGKLAYTSSPGAYPNGYNPDLFYYGFSYVHYTPVAYGNQPSFIVRFGLASSLENAMERTPIVFADGGSGNLQFKSYGKFIKLVTPVPECCDLPYFNEGQPLLQLYPSSSSFDPEGLNVFDDSYNDALVQHSQINHDKLKKSVSFTCGVTRNSVPVDNSAPSGYSLIHTEGEISEVISWLNQEQVLYHHSDQDFTLGKNFQSTVKKTYYAKQGRTTAGSVPIYPGHLGYANGRRKTRSVNLLYYPFTEYFVENQLLVFNFSVDFGDPSGFIPYTPGPDKIVYILSITGQFHQYGDYEQQKTISITYKLTEDFDLINLGHLSGSKVLTLVPITSSQMGYGPNYYINIPSTLTVTFSDDDYSAEVLPASLTLVSPEKYLQTPCRLAGPMSGVGIYSSPSGLVIIDGIQTVEGDRIFVTASSAIFGRGVWVASSGTWTRPTNWNLKNSYFEILEGSNAGKKFFLAVNDYNTGSSFSSFGVFPSEHNWTVNNYTDELPTSITLNKVAGYNNYEAEFATAVNVRNYIRLKLYDKSFSNTELGYIPGLSYFGFTFQQWVQDSTYDGYWGTRYLPSGAPIVFFNKAVHVADAEADGSLFYPAPATVKMLSSYSGLITIRLFKMAGMTNGSTGSSENSITVQYLLDWPLDITPTPPPS
jgi:hypothetical protein